MVDEFAHGTSIVGDHRRPARQCLHDAVPEGFVEVDQVEQGVGAPENVGALRRSDRAEVSDVVAVEMRLDLLSEVALVLDDAGDVEPASGPTRDVDRVRRALVGMDPPEEQQVISG